MADRFFTNIHPATYTNTAVSPQPASVPASPPAETNTLKVAADRLGCSVRTLMRALASNQIRAVKLRGRWRISEAEMRRILRDGIGIQP